MFYRGYLDIFGVFGLLVRHIELLYVNVESETCDEDFSLCSDIFHPVIVKISGRLTEPISCGLIVKWKLTIYAASVDK